MEEPDISSLNTSPTEFGRDLFEIFNSNDNQNETIEYNEFEKFLKDNYNEKIVLLTQSNFQELQRPMVTIFHNFYLKETKFWIDKLYEVAQKFSNSIKFAVADYEEVKLFQCECNDLDLFGLGVDIEPYCFALDAEGRQHNFKNAFTVDELTNFCQLLAENQLYLSDPIPRISNPYIDTVVADNFQELIEENDKDVLLTLHNTCTFQYPYYLWDLTHNLREDRDVLVFYKINAQTNYILPKYRVSEYPVSFFIPRNNKNKLLRYDQINYYDNWGISKFIAKNSTTELKYMDRTGRERKSEKLQCYNIEAENQEERSDDDFLQMLGKILNKVSENERNSLKIELLTLTAKRVDNILKGNNAT